MTTMQLVDFDEQKSSAAIVQKSEVRLELEDPVFSLSSLILEKTFEKASKILKYKLALLTLPFPSNVIGDLTVYEVHLSNN